VIKASYEAHSLESAFKGQDAVISLVGNAGFHDQERFIDAAIAAGVKWFVPSEFGSNTADERNLKIVPIFDDKRNVVEYLKSKESQGLSWTALITGMFFDWGLARGALEFHVSTKTARIWDGGDIPFSTTNLATIGKALAGLLTNPDALQASKNKYIYIASHTATQNEILAVLEKVTGEKWTVEHIKSSEAVPKATKALQDGDFRGILTLIQAANFAEGRLNDFTQVEGGLSNNLLLPGVHEDLEQDVRRVLNK